MIKQRGVTLVELLVVIAIVGAVFVPIALLVNNSLKTEQKVNAKNDVQREARLIMKYITEKMKNKNVVWIEENDKLKLKKCGEEDIENLTSPNCSDSEPYLIYDPQSSTMTTGEGNVLSRHVILELQQESDSKEIKIVLTIDKTEETGESFLLDSVISNQRFNTINVNIFEETNIENDGGENNEGNNEDDVEDGNGDQQEDSSEDKKNEFKCPPGQAKKEKC